MSVRISHSNFRDRIAKRLLFSILVALISAPIAAQNFQTKFSEIKFDQSKGPATLHGGAEVDIATGGIRFNIPLGPGIGRGDFIYQPALRGTSLPQAPIKLVPIISFVGYNQNIHDEIACPPTKPQLSWLEVPYGVADSYLVDDQEERTNREFMSLTPGYVYLNHDARIIRDTNSSWLCYEFNNAVADVESEMDYTLAYMTSQRPAHYLGPNGESGSIVAGPVPSNTNILNSILPAFGMGGASWEVMTDYSPCVMTDGSLYIPLSSPTRPSINLMSDYIEGFGPNYYYSVPSVILIVKGDLALEYEYDYSNYGKKYSMALPDPMIYGMGSFYSLVSMRPRTYGHNNEKIAFEGGSLGDYTAKWTVNGSALATVTVTRNSVTYSTTAVGTTTATATPPNYTIGVTTYRSTWLDQEGVSTYPYLKTIKGWTAMQVSSIKENWTGGETITFTYDNIGTTTWSSLTRSYSALTKLAYTLSGRTIEFAYGKYEYLKNESDFIGYFPQHYPALGISQGILTMLPAYAYGVTSLTEKDTKATGTMATRTTTYARQVPIPETRIGYSSSLWYSTAFQTTATHPDGSKTIHKFAEPPDNSYLTSPSYQGKMQILAYLKAMETGRETYGTNGTEHLQSQATDRFSTLVHHNPFTSTYYQGNPMLNPVPYPTRTRIHDRLDAQHSIAELLEWENDTGTPLTGRGWKETRQSISAGAPASMEINYIAASPPPAASTGTVTIKDLQTFSSNRLAHWLFGFTATSKQTRIVSGATEESPLTTYNWDTNVNNQWIRRLTSIVESKGTLSRTTSFTYKGTTGLLASQLASALVTGTGYTGTTGVAEYTYDTTSGWLTKIRPQGVTYQYEQTQDNLGRIISQKDPNSLTTAYTYDHAGRLTSITPPGETPTAIAIDTDSRGYKLTRGSIVQAYRYNAFGELVMEKQGSGYRLHAYDKGSRLTSSSNWGAYSSSEHAWATGSLSVASSKTTLTYNTSGRLASETDLNNILKTITYSNRKQTITIGRAPNTAATEIDKDIQGRVIKVKDALDQIINYTYDNFDRLSVTTQTGASGTQTRKWFYNSMGGLVLLNQPESGATYYTNFHISGAPQYTAYGLAIGWAPANYDGNYSTTASSQPGVKKVTTTFDAAGRLATLASADAPAISQTFTYDETTAGASRGKLTTATANGVTKKHTYSTTTGRLTRLDRIIDGHTFTQQIAYNTLGEVSSRTYPDGRIQTINYESTTGLPLNSTFNSTTATFINNLTALNITSIAALGMTTGYTYRPDQVGLAGMTHQHTAATTLSRAWNYTYNDLDLMTSDGEDYYEYDKLGRLTKAFIKDEFGSNGIRQTLAYDAFGNRISGITDAISGWNGTVTPPFSPVLATLRTDVQTNIANSTFTPTHTAFQKNQIPSQTSSGAFTGTTYNQQGNLTQVYPQPGASTRPINMAYDSLGRVTSVSHGISSGRKTENYLYDEEGLRIKIQEGTTTRYNIYNEQRQLIAQYEKVGSTLTWKKDIVYVGTKEIFETNSTGNSVTLNDHLGSPRHIWNGTTLTKQKFMPFGEQLTDTLSMTKYAKGFTNHEQTDPSQLIYMQARYYVPAYGKFASPDPGRDQHFDYTQSWNIYSYTRNNPIIATDPTGMWGKIIKKGNNITIQGRINVRKYNTNAGRMEHNKELQIIIENQIRSDWGGQKGKYNVTVDLDKGPETTFDVHDLRGGSYTVNRMRVHLFTKERIRGTNKFANPNNTLLAQVASHEYGHSTAMIFDKCEEKTEVPFPGYENDIMGGGREVSERTIDDMINENIGKKRFIDMDRDKSIWEKLLEYILRRVE